MVKILEEAQVDQVNEEVDATLTAAEEAEFNQRFTPPANPGDLSNGGKFGGVKLTPMSGWGGVPMKEGRPAARRAWAWNGTETLLPLAWNPDGNMHDGARRYLLKRHCACCHFGGFRGRRCPGCSRNNCTSCQGGTKPGVIIPQFYLNKEDVPFPQKFYGSVDCFLPLCPRHGDRGFKTDQDMRIHARSRHRMEYQAYLETLSPANHSGEVAELREQVAQLTNLVQTRASAAERMAKVRAARKNTTS